MKVNKPISPFAGGADAPTDKDIARAINGDKFAETLAALENAAGAPDSAPDAARAALTEIARQYDLFDEKGQQQAIAESADFLVKSRLNEKQKKIEKGVQDLTKYVAEDPFLKNKLLSVLKKLSDTQK